MLTRRLRGYRRTTGAIVSAVLLIAVLPTSASAVTAVTFSDREPLVGPWANFTCSTLRPLDDGPMRQGPGHVTFRVERGGVLSARVVLRGARPTTEYIVRLVQGARDCYTVDGVFKTDDQGNGSLRVAEPIGRHQAQIAVNTGRKYGHPAYRARHAFLQPLR